ncbi:FGGY family carbohydrate kinase [uncultured Amaricoccus sp.]|uniref:FGGY-family carbohydrate kinase n=1 Tax=uncultured Amaricoccus sp. TaxID=339341 RepID=UPI00262E81F3|nr:FGGY family carbohydrate kinase [uncultured Amaricoccus sp.]
MDPSHVAVIDFGKTNVKLAIVDLAAEREVAERRMPNEVRQDGPFPHYDTERHWRFLLDSLGKLGADWPIGAIAITTHGATAALVDAGGAPVLPILDYEHPLPTGAYDALRPDFARTGSPRLGAGLNLGAQLHWLFTTFRAETARTAHILTYPEYWAMRLSGVAAVEATSLGCHTDLWNPRTGDFSTLVDAMGWRRLLPPLRRAGEVLGPLLPEIAARTGLAPGVPVLCGIHDSNASLLAHLNRWPAPFAVVSTGTWVVAMAVGAAPKALDPARDLLVNVNALGEPTPSARFMGGREYEIIRAGRDFAPDAAARARVLGRGLMLLPAVEPDYGPFRGRRGGWTARPGDAGEEAVALAFYLALTTAEALDLLGAAGPALVEGPFARNADYLDMLEAAIGRPALAAAGGATGTAVGAALLAHGIRSAAGRETPPPRRTDDLGAYAAEWRRRVRAGEPPNFGLHASAGMAG